MGKSPKESYFFWQFGRCDKAVIQGWEIACQFPLQPQREARGKSSEPPVSCSVASARSIVNVTASTSRQGAPAAVSMPQRRIQ